MASGIAAWLAGLVRDRDPSATALIARIPETASQRRAPRTRLSHRRPWPPRRLSPPAIISPAPNRRILRYFLIRQAQEMVGKSFIEVMRMLVPAYVETARSTSDGINFLICRSSEWRHCWLEFALAGC